MDTVPEHDRAAPRDAATPLPLTAQRLVELLVGQIGADHRVRNMRSTTTIYGDRRAVTVEDHHGQLWRVHVMHDPIR